MSGKKLIGDTFEGRTRARTPFIPFIYTFAARLRGVGIQEMLTNPTLLANSLQDAYMLFCYDGVVTSFDQTLEAEACGCEVVWEEGKPPRISMSPLSKGIALNDLNITGFLECGRVPTVLEVTKRLKAVLGKEAGIIGTLTGPLTLFQHLKGEPPARIFARNPREAAEILEVAGVVSTTMARSYGELDIDIIMILEDTTLASGVLPASCLLPIYESLSSVIGFYNAHSFLLLRGFSGEHDESIFDRSEFDCIARPASGQLAKIKDRAIGNWRCFGGGIPAEVLFAPEETIAGKVMHLLSSCGERGFILTTEWEVPYDTPIEGMHAVMKALNHGSDKDS